MRLGQRQPLSKLIEGTSHAMDGGGEDLIRGMSPVEIAACKELFVSMLNRTPDAMKSVISRSRPKINDAISELDLTPIQRFPGSVQADLIMRITQSAMAHVASSSHRHVPGGVDLSDAGLVVAAYTNPKSSLILGSCGVAHLASAGDPEYLDGTWLPITPSQAIGLDDDPTTISFHKDDERLRRRINEALAKHSRRIAGHSKKLVKRHTALIGRNLG